MVTKIGGPQNFDISTAPQHFGAETKVTTEEEESSNLPACRISEIVSSLVPKLGLHFVVGELEFHFCISQYAVCAGIRVIPTL